MTRLSVRLLGALHVALGGSPLTGFESDKERALLAYLAAESQQAHRREKLAGLLWPELTEAAARNNLRRVLSNVRRLLGDRTQVSLPFLLVADQTIRLNPDCDASIDSQAFDSLLNSPGQRIGQQLEKAIQLYQGDFLEGFSLADSPAYEEWMVLCRERYQRMMLEALLSLVHHHESKGDFEAALRLAWRQLEMEPWREEAYQQLMRLLALSGRRSEALAQYHRCRRLLAEELDVAPSAETTGLFLQIRDGSLAATAPSPERRTGPTHNLPLASGPFVGRASEISEIQACLHNPACRLLSLVGAGGMGKTRLALEAVTDWISQLDGRELEGVTLVSMEPDQTPESAVIAIAQAVGFPPAPGREPRQQLLGFLSEKHWLLILDSVEHIWDRAEFVAEILAGATYVRILATSRVRLSLQDEYCFPVVGLGYPEDPSTDVQQAGRFAAVQLFLEAATRVQPGFEPADADLIAISRICRLVQGMPLGILLAAAWLTVLRPSEIATEIETDLSFLEADWADVPLRQRNIRAVFDRSWNLLSEREQEVLEALSVFSGGFTRGAAEWVSGASLRDLKSLTDKSLLQYTPSGRYQIHELLRQYAASKPSFLPDSREASANRHCAYYCTALHRWEKDLTSSRQQEALSEMEAERENIRAAWYWAVDQGKVSKLDQAMEGLEHFYWQSGRYRPGKAALQAAAAAANSDAAKSDDQVAWLRVSARALAWQSNFERAIGQRDTACQLQQRCLEILQDPALAGVDTRLEHAILSWTMGATICMADYAQGRQRFEESLSLFRELDHLWGMAWALNASGTMSLFLGAYQEAESRLEEGLSIYRTLGNQAGVAGSLSRLASVASVKGRFEAAERLAREGFTTSSQVGSRTQSALALLDLGLALENVAKFSEAHATLQQSLALFRDLGYRHYVTQAHSFMSSIDLHLGRYESARDHAQTGLTLAHEHGPPFCVALNLLLLGSLAMAEGDHAQAYRQLADAIPVTHDVGERADLSRAIAVLALAALDLGNSRESRQYLSQALGLAVELGAVPPLLWALPCASLLLAGQGEIERAVELYALACRYQLVAKSRWFADVAGNTLARVATTLPAERVVILQERGQVLDPMATAGELLADFSR